MLNGAIVMYGAVVLYTQRGWIPYLKKKLGGRTSLTSVFKSKTTAKEPPSLQTAAEYVNELVLYFEQLDCKDGKASAIKCGELLSHAMFCRKGQDAAKT